MPTFPQIPVDVIDRAGLDEAVRALTPDPELAVDVEADSMRAFRARLCYVQLGTDRHIFLLDTLVPEVRADALKPLLEDPARIKFFHAAGGDLQYLAEAGVRVRRLFDTHRAATLLGTPKVGLADLVRERLGVELKKEHQQADFSRRPLPKDVHDYIAEDVRYLCEIGRQVREDCRKADILEEVELDCERMVDEAEGRPEIAPFKLKLNKAGLTPQAIQLANAIGPALHVLRLKWAEAANLPMGLILSNATIGEIAAHPPADTKALTRHMRGATLSKYGDELLATLAELAARQQKGELPPAAEVERDPKRSKRDDVLRSFRSEQATKRKVTPSVVLTNPLVEALAKTPPASVEELTALRYFGEKRVRLYGADLVKLLEKHR